jgi:ketosteroid isomerase-like protein
MKKRISYFINTLPLIFLIVVLYSCQKNHPSVEKEQEAIKQTLTDMWDAIEKEDIERYASYIHPDFTQFGETDSVLRIGKSAEIEGISSWVENSSDIHTEMLEPRITVKGNTAWIVYYWSDRGISEGKTFTSRGKSTRIFVKEDGKWLCIHGHYTLLS